MDTMTLKEKVMQDMYNIMFTTKFNIDPDNWDIQDALIRAYINVAGIKFIDKSQIPDSECWPAKYETTEEWFLYETIPGVYHTFTQFCYLYDTWIDWELTEMYRNADKVMAGVSEAVNRLKPAAPASSDCPTVEQLKGMTWTVVNSENEQEYEKVKDIFSRHGKGIWVS